MTTRGLPPWHTWGVDETLNFTTLTGLNLITRQLTRIDYKRPDSWRFLVFLKTLESDQANPNWSVTAAFQLMIGIGRSNVVIPNWIVLTTGLQAVGAQPQLLTSTAPTVGLVTPGAGGTALQAFSDVIVGQQINVSCNATANAAAGTLAIQVGAYFAPASHIRPDWYERVPVFAGEEIDGH